MRMFAVLSAAAVALAAAWFSGSQALAAKPKKKAGGLEGVFKKADADNNGSLSQAEFDKALTKAKNGAKNSAKLFGRLDADNSGDVSAAEFKKLGEGKAVAKKKKKDA